MVAAGLIERKRDGEALAAAEWRALLAAYLAGEVPDYQMAALLMAVVFRGLAPHELDAVADAMLTSGDRLAFPGEPRPRVDKHSTGGVGDKTSLVLAPLLAACGAVVPMISGRGLGHTGGTLDKLEAIPGFRTDLDLRRAERQARDLGCVMLGQTEALCPLDRRLYALRDVTGTVPSVPLIAASIMSKKLAEGLTGLVLDVKVGSGAFLPGLDRARELARTMVALGAARGVPTVTLLTAMDRPLGVACGNALEVAESLALLRGGGPAGLREVTLALGTEMLLVGGLATDPAAARARLEAALGSGAALEVFRRLVAAQGGDVRVVDDPSRLPRAPVVGDVTAARAGVVAAMDVRALGRAIVALGGGRRVVTDRVDPAVGLEVLVAPGDRVEPGTPLARVHARDEAALAAARAAVASAVTLGERAEPLPLVVERIAGGA